MGDLPDWQTRISTGDDDILFTGTLAANGFTAVLDVSAYESLQIFVPGATRASELMYTAQWFDTAGDGLTADQLTGYPSGFFPVQASMQIPVRSPKLQVTNLSAYPLPFVILGSQRAVTGMVGNGYIDHWSMVNAAAAMVAGTFYDIGVGSLVPSQGWHQMEFTLGSATVAGGWYLSWDNGLTSAQNMLIADSIEGHVAGSATILTKQVILPASAAKLRFQCRTAGTASIVVNAVALGH